MVVCHCQAVTDRAIRAAVRKGARTRREVSKACAASLRCGGCAPAVDAIIRSEMQREDEAGLTSLVELAVTDTPARP